MQTGINNQIRPGLEATKSAAAKPVDTASPEAEKPATITKKDAFHKAHDYEFFKDDLYARDFVVYDPLTGQASFYKTEEEMQEHQAAILERRKQDLMVASAGDPASLQAIQNNIRSAKLQVGLKDEYLSHDEDRAAVIAAAKSQAGSMTVSELKLLAQGYPEINSIVDDRIAQAKVRGISQEDIANMQVTEIDELAKRKLAAPQMSS